MDDLTQAYAHATEKMEDYTINILDDVIKNLPTL